MHRTCTIPNTKCAFSGWILLHEIHCSDAGLQAAMASVKTDNDPNHMWDNYEEVPVHFLPYGPEGNKWVVHT